MPDDIASLERRISQLTKQVQLLMWLWVGAISIAVCMNTPCHVHAATAQNLKVRRLNEDNQNVIMSTHNSALFEITRGKNIISKQPPDAPDLKQ